MVAGGARPELTRGGFRPAIRIPVQHDRAGQRVTQEVIEPPDLPIVSHPCAKTSSAVPFVRLVAAMTGAESHDFILASDLGSTRSSGVGSLRRSVLLTCWLPHVWVISRWLL